MKRILFCIAVGVVGALVIPGGAQAAGWKSCGPTSSAGQPENFVWVQKGRCEKAISVVRAFYVFATSDLPEEIFGKGGSTSASARGFDCNHTSDPPRFRLRCEASPTLILGLDRADSDPNEWKTPPAITRTLTRKQAIAMMRDFVDPSYEEQDDKEKLKVRCPKRLTRLSFRCSASYFDRTVHVRVAGRVTKQLNGNSSSGTHRYYNRTCLRAGGSLKKCELKD